MLVERYEDGVVMVPEVLLDARAEAYAACRSCLAVPFGDDAQHLEAWYAACEVRVDLLEAEWSAALAAEPVQ